VTDDELIELVGTHSPEELSLEQVDALRQAMHASPALRAALAERLEMEQYLGEALGRFEVPIDRILERAGRQPGNRSLLWLLGWSTAVVLLIAAGVGLVYRTYFRPEQQPQVENQPLAQIDEPPPIEAEPPIPAPAEPEPPSSSEPPTESPAAAPAETAPKTPAASSQSPTTVASEAPAEPWTAIATSDAPLRPAAEAAFDESLLEPSLAAAEFRRWVEPVAGQPYNAKEQNASTVFDGLGRLLAPWRDDLGLRVWMHDHHGLKLHFWNGHEGVTLMYYAYPPAWVAYQTTRAGDEPRPATFALAATDNHRWARSGGGRFELRHTDGYLRISRGDLLVLAAPLAKPPKEVYLDGRATIRAVAIERSQPVPLVADVRPVIVNMDQPANADWSGELPEGAKLDRLPDGSVELKTTKTTAAAHIWTPLAKTGLCEAIFELDNPQPGCGVFLGDAMGKPLHEVRFFHESRSGATSYGFITPGDSRTESNHDIAQHPTPLALKRQWLRLVLGCGTLKCWTSSDGQHWSRAMAPIQSTKGLAPFQTIGLACVKTDQPRTLRLCSFQLRSLPALERLLPPELDQKALALTGDGELELAGWLRQVIDNQPVDVPPDEWRRACAVKSLAAGVSTKLGNGLILGLLDEAISLPASLDERLALLEQMALIAPTGDGSHFRELALALAQRYEQLGNRLIVEGEDRPYTAIASALRRTPIMTEAPLPLLPESLVRYEFLHLAQLDRWEEAVELAGRINFWSRPADPNRRQNRDGLLALADWAEGSAFRSLSTRRTGTASVLRAEWRHPLFEVLSKEGYNILAEFNAALEGQSYHDACQIISSADPHGALGLLPDARDDHLLVSLPAAVQMAMREHVALRQTMNDEFGPRGRLRVQQAIAEGDRVALEAATTQFSGTAAAALAHLWLGDRALASGDFTQATGQYQRALASDPQSLGVRARLRLAAAMLGRNEQSPLTAEVEIGEIRYTAAEFEALVAELLRARSGTAAGGVTLASSSTASAVPAPARLVAKRFGSFDGDLGSDPQQTQYPELDWAGRQLAATVAGKRLYVSNRFQVVAYDLATGDKKWSAELSKEHGHAHSWPLAPMPPLIAGQQLFQRRITTKGPELACFDLEKEKLLWTARPGDHVATDPLLVQDQLLAITISVPQEGLLQLHLTSLEPRTGEMLSQRPLVQLRDVWNRQVPCQLALAGDQIVAHCGGAVLCCDLLGQVRWLRRRVWLPQSVDPDWPRQYVEPPLVQEGLVYLSQPGVREVQCLELASGRLRWQRTMPSLRRLVQVSQERLLVEDDTGIVALDAATGEPAWSYSTEALLHAQLSDNQQVLICCRQQIDKESQRPCLIWLEAATGRELARSPLVELADKQPMLGPMVSQGKRLWTFFGRGGRDATREIHELKAQGPAEALAIAGQPLDEWKLGVDATLCQAARAAMPGWTLLASHADKQTHLHAQLRGRRNVLATVARPERPASFVHWLNLPEDAQAKLVLKVGHEPDQRWRLEVRIGGDSVLSQAIEAAATNQGWKDLEIDLSRYAGRPQWLVVAQHNLESKPTHAYWQQLDVIRATP
jgi:outer membrane protein assembly factor BamB